MGTAVGDEEVITGQFAEIVIKVANHLARGVTRIHYTNPGMPRNKNGCASPCTAGLVRGCETKPPSAPHGLGVVSTPALRRVRVYK